MRTFDKYATTCIACALLMITAVAQNSNKECARPQCLTTDAEGNMAMRRYDEFLLDTAVAIVKAAEDQQNPAVAFGGSDYLVVWGDGRDVGSSFDIYAARVDQTGDVLDTLNIAISEHQDYEDHPCVAFDGTNYIVAWELFISGSDFDINFTRVSQTGSVLDPTPGVITATNRQLYPTVAFDGTQYMMVWQDDRNSLGDYDIYGGRIDTSGVLIDTHGIAICTVSNDQYRPAIAFDGTNYLVVWADYHSGSNWDIYGARITQSGTVLDTNGIQISTAPNDIRRLAVAFGDSNYLVVWQDTRGSSYDVYGARIDTAGTVLDTGGFAIVSEAEQQSVPSVAFDGEYYLVAWTDFRDDVYGDLYCTRVTQDGIVLDTNGVPVSTAQFDQDNASIVSDNSDYFVVWQDHRDSHDESDIRGARVAQSGTVLDTSGVLISTQAYVYPHGVPAVSFDGEHFFVVWEDGRNQQTSKDLYAMRVDSSGNLLDTTCIAVTDTNYTELVPAVASGDTMFLVVWVYFQAGNTDIMCARVSHNGTLFDTVGIPVSLDPPYHNYPDVAFDGTNFLVVWQDFRDWVSENVYGARVSQSGEVLDTSAILISPQGGEHTYPAVAFDGTNYLVVWVSGYGYKIWGARVDTSGAVIDTGGFRISGDRYALLAPDVAFDGTNYFVVWQDEHEFGTYGARVTPQAVVLDSPVVAISTSSAEQKFPCVAFDGSDYMVAWQDHRHLPDHRDIYGARVSTAGTVIDSFEVSTMPEDQRWPAIASGTGGQVLVVYQSWTDSINNFAADVNRTWGRFFRFTGVSEEEQHTGDVMWRGLHVFPNPVRDICYVMYRGHNTTFEEDIGVSLYDVTGRRIRELIQMEWFNGVYCAEFDVSSLPQGVYFLSVHANGHSITKKLVFVE